MKIVVKKEVKKKLYKTLSITKSPSELPPRYGMGVVPISKKNLKK